MPELRLTIPAELDGQTVRQAAMKGLGMSNGLFKRAKFHGQVLLDGVPVLANAAVRQGHLAIALEAPADTLELGQGLDDGLVGDAHFGGHRDGRRACALWQPRYSGQ